MTFASRHLLTALCGLTLAACNGGSNPPDETTKPLGFGYIDSGCFVTPASDYIIRDVIIWYDLASEKTASATLSDVNISTPLCGELNTIPLRNADQEQTFHSLSEALDFGIAWRGGKKNPKPLTDTVSFSSCTTSEGIRYRATDKVSGDVVWEGYQPLGYDTEADCQD